MAEIQAVGAVAGAVGGMPTNQQIANQGTGPSRQVIDILDLQLRQQSAEPGLRAALADPSKLAEKVMESLESMRADYTSLMGQAEARLEPGPAALSSNPADGPAVSTGPQALADRMASAQQEIKELMWLQLNIGKVLVQEQLMSKVAGRSTQNIDTLLRGQ